MVACRICNLCKMEDVVWNKVMLAVLLACVVSCCHATVPMYLIQPPYTVSTWDDTRSICQGLGTNGWLAMTKTSDQASAFKKLLTQQRVGGPGSWIGLYRKHNGGQFYWVNNDAVPATQLAIDWYPGQPDNSGGDENCVQVRPVYNGDWELDDKPCSPGYGHIACQLPDEAPPSLSVTADVVEDGGQVNLTCSWNRPIPWAPMIYTYRKEGSADILEKKSRIASDTHTLASVNVSDTGRYWCAVGATLYKGQLNFETLSTSNSIHLRVIPDTPTFSLDPPLPVYDGTQVTFQCASNSTTGVSIVPTYHFIRDGIIIKSTNLTYTKNVTTSDIGNYACKVTMNGVDSALSNNITVEVSAVPNTTATPATTKKPGLSPEMKVTVGIQLAGFVAGLFGLLGMCVPMVYVCLRRACCKRDNEEKENDDHDDEDEDEHVRKVHWKSEKEEEEKETEKTKSTVSSILSHAGNAVSAVWSGASGGMSTLMPGPMPGGMKRGSDVDVAKMDEGRSPDTCSLTSTSESPRGSVISRLFGSDLFVPRLSGSAISPSEVSRKQ